MVLSHAGVAKLLESDCRCHSVDAPDDMWLGSCFRSITPMVHTNSFHQVSPTLLSFIETLDLRKNNMFNRNLRKYWDSEKRHSEKLKAFGNPILDLGVFSSLIFSLFALIFISHIYLFFEFVNFDFLHNIIFAQVYKVNLAYIAL